jgi:hypothetical protein
MIPYLEPLLEAVPSIVLCPICREAAGEFYDLTGCPSCSDRLVDLPLALSVAVVRRAALGLSDGPPETTVIGGRRKP